MVCGLFYGVWVAVVYVVCCMVCELLNGIGLLYGMWAFVAYVGSCMECGLL